jgi:hypothetical protein
MVTDFHPATAVVDSALEVVDEYHTKILKLEHDILLKPKMKTIRYCKHLPFNLGR